MSQRAVFLDRDGVINETLRRNGGLHPPACAEDVRILPGVPSACIELRNAGFLLIVVTNQPDVARGTQTREEVERINQIVRVQVPVDDIRVCYHDDADNCLCRKPRPGLLVSAATDWQVDLRESYMVGDRWKDIAAGLNAGCRTILIGREPHDVHPDFTAGNLPEAAKWILQ